MNFVKRLIIYISDNILGLFILAIIPYLFCHSMGWRPLWVRWLEFVLYIGAILGVLQAFTDNRLGVRDRIENEKDLEEN